MRSEGDWVTRQDLSSPREESLWSSQCHRVVFQPSRPLGHDSLKSNYISSHESGGSGMIRRYGYDSDRGAFWGRTRTGDGTCKFVKSLLIPWICQLDVLTA